MNQCYLQLLADFNGQFCRKIRPLRKKFGPFLRYFSFRNKTIFVFVSRKIIIVLGLAYYQREEEQENKLSRSLARLSWQWMVIHVEEVYNLLARLTFQVLPKSIYGEYRAVSCVFQDIEPSPASPTGDYVLPPLNNGGGGEVGGQYFNILEDARHRIGLFQ